MTIQVATTVSGEGHSTAFIQDPSDALFFAAMLLAGRFYYRGEAPLGIAGGSDFGGVYVGWTDPDLRKLLIGRRGREISPDQVWPTVEQIKDRWRISTTVADDRVTEVRAAALDHLATLVGRRSWGIA